MQIAVSKTRKKFPLSPKKIWKKTIGGNITALLFLLFYFSFSFRASKAFPEIASFVAILTVGLIIFVVLILGLNYFYQRWYYAVYFYDLTDDYVIIKKGPITPREITIPYERIQDVYVDQDLLDRLFNIYDVHLSTATATSGMEAHIDGVEKPAADGLRTLLLETVSKKISKVTTPAS